MSVDDLLIFNFFPLTFRLSPFFVIFGAKIKSYDEYGNY